MFNGELYRQINSVQRLVAKELTSEFANRIQLRPDGQDSLLDVGCGTGDITIDYIAPLLNPEFTRIVGGDISESMLRVARQSNRNAKISFEIFDIQNPRSTTPFEHITSFFCLHFVKDQRQLFRNIYNLLAPAGDALLGYIASHPCYDVLTQMAKHPRWAPYLKDVETLIPPFQFSNDIISPLESILNDIGYSEHSVQVRDINAINDGLDHYKCE